MTIVHKLFIVSLSKGINIVAIEVMKLAVVARAHTVSSRRKSIYGNSTRHDLNLLDKSTLKSVKITSIKSAKCISA